MSYQRNFHKPSIKTEKPKTRVDRAGISVDPLMLEKFTNEDAMWAEAQLARADVQVRAICRDVLITWAWTHVQQLPPAQRASMELHFFRGLSMPRAGQLLGRHASVISRAKTRAVESLRAARPRDGRIAHFADLYRFGIDRRVLRRLREEARARERGEQPRR
jgi:hypothetical protein